MPAGNAGKIKMKNIKQIILVLIIVVFTSCSHGGNTNKSFEAKSSQVSGMKSETGVKNALAFINGYVENANKLKQSVDTVDWVKSNNLSTKGFKKELKRLMDKAGKDPDSGLDADPVFDAQDFPDKGFELESFDEKTDYMTVRGIDWPEFKLTMKILFENGNWLVDGCGMINIPKNKRAER